MASSSNKTQQKNDFNPNDLTQSVDKHGQDLADIKERLEKIESKFGTNEKIADTLCETAEKATKMKEMIRETFLNLVIYDVKIKDSMYGLVNTADRKFLSATLKRLGAIIWSIIMIVIGVLITVAITKLTK